jgi:hypothetical protein
MLNSCPGARLVAMVALFALPALAQARAARLLDGADVPAAAGESKLHLVPVASDVLGPADGPGFGEHFIKTFSVSILGASAGAVVGTAFGSLSINLGVTAVGALLPNLLIGPLVTVIAALLVGNEGALTGRFSFWGPLGVATLVNAATYVIASLFLVVPWTNPAVLLLYSLVDGLLMTGGSVGLMHLTAPKASAAVLPSFVPGVSATQVVSLGKVDF